MSVWKAFAYFVREAALGLRRGWGPAAVAVLTIGLSLFLSGWFFLLSQNLGRGIERFSGQPILVVYLKVGIEPDGEEGARLEERLREADWVSEVTALDRTSAAQRFRETFPSLAGMLDETGDTVLPASFEASLDMTRMDEARFEEWLYLLERDPAVELVDDDRDWLAQLGTLLGLVRGGGLALATVLLLAAIFTIASVIRLAAYRYLDEIAVMRLVGATEFFIRGPFWTEGLLQGLLGGGVAIVALRVVWSAMSRAAVESPWLSVLAGDFLTVVQQVVLVTIGGLAGLLGAILSLRRETLHVEE